MSTESLIDEPATTRRHYHAYSFIANAGPNAQTYACVYLGYPDKLVTPARIQYAKQQAGVPVDAVLIGLSYLGRMTRAELAS